jgi:hypothetical protein
MELKIGTNIVINNLLMWVEDLDQPNLEDLVLKDQFTFPMETLFDAVP